MKTESEKALETAMAALKAYGDAVARQAVQDFVARMAESADMPAPKGRGLLRAPAPKQAKAARRQAATPTTATEGKADTKLTTPEAKPKAAPAPKRSEEAIGILMEKLRGYIEEVPGQNVEEIGKAIGHTTAELRLPIAKLLKAGSIRSEGTKRATRYYSAGEPKKQTTNGAARRVVVDESHEQGAEA